MADVIKYRFVLRRGLAADWTAKNEVLLQGEFGLELDTAKLKIGDGSTAWNDLEYFGGVSNASQLPYDNTSSGLAAEDVQAAIDEMSALVAASGSDYFTNIDVVPPGASLTTGTGKAVWFAPFDGSFKSVFIGLLSVSSSGSVSIDIKNAAGQSIFTTPPSIDTGDHSSIQGTEAVLDTSKIGFSRGDFFSFNVTGAGTGAGGLKAVLQYGLERLSTGWRLAVALYTGQSYAPSTTEYTGAIQGMHWSPDGLNLYIGRVSGTTTFRVFRIQLTTAWDLTTASYTLGQYATLTTQVSGGNGFYITPDGLRLYCFSSSNSSLYQYTFGTAWDITTLSYASKTVGLGGSNNQNLRFRADGMRYFFTDYSNNRVVQANLTTAWDISTASQVAYVSQSAPTGLEVSNDGKRMWVTNYASSVVVEWLLASAWDITSAYVSGTSFSFGGQESQAQAMYVDQDTGGVMFITGNSPNTVFKYSTA